MSEINLSKVDDLIEARIRFHLFESKQADQVTNWERRGASVVEAGVVLLSASLQAFVEDVFIECSEKAFKKTLQGEALKRYKKTWERWGNPSPANITRLFRRLGCDDVFGSFSLVRLTKSEFRETLDKMNSARNCIAHGKPVRHGSSAFKVSLPVLRKWRDQIHKGSGALRFSALHQSGL